jgi:hypothetical protein
MKEVLLVTRESCLNSFDRRKSLGLIHIPTPSPLRNSAVWCRYNKCSTRSISTILPVADVTERRYDCGKLGTVGTCMTIFTVAVGIVLSNKKQPTKFEGWALWMAWLFGIQNEIRKTTAGFGRGTLD